METLTSEFLGQAIISDVPAATRLPLDVLVALMEKRLIAAGYVITDLFLGALVSSEWREAVGVAAGMRPLLHLSHTLCPSPTDGPHGGPLDGPKAVAPLVGGGVVIADTRNNRLRRTSMDGALLDDGLEMGVDLPDSVAVQRTGCEGVTVWATNRGSGPIVLKCGPLGKRGKFGMGVSMPRADGRKQRVISIHFSRALSVQLLLLESHVKAVALDAHGEEVPADDTSDAAEDGSRLPRCFGQAQLSNALCLTSHGNLVYVGDGDRHAILVFACTPWCERASFVRQIGNHTVGSVFFRDPISVAVGRSAQVKSSLVQSAQESRALLHVADWDRIHVLTLEGVPLQALPMVGRSTRRVNGICIDDDGEALWAVSAEQHSLHRFSPFRPPGALAVPVATGAQPEPPELFALSMRL